MVELANPTLLSPRARRVCNLTQPTATFPVEVSAPDTMTLAKSRIPQTNGDVSHSEREYSIPETYLGSRRPIKVIVIGFGASAINLAHILGQQGAAKNISLQCYEKNPEIGGTWFENT